MGRQKIEAEFAVIGAGSFGAWTALELTRRGKRVVLIDSHGPANSRASSGGETRIIRMSYGDAGHYTEMSWRSLREWKNLFSLRDEELFLEAGALFTARKGNAHLTASLRNLRAAGIPAKPLSESALRKRYPQLRMEPGSEGLIEPQSGVLLARRAVQLAAARAVEMGAVYLQIEADPAEIRRRVRADAYLWACGPWLPSLFPSLLGGRIWPTRQDVFFFGTTPGDTRFHHRSMPAWVDFTAEVYAVPDVENRGFKIALDRHGPAFDPETGERTVGAKQVREMRTLLQRYVPTLAEAPVVETRVCQYENTSDGEFLIDWLEPGVMAIGGGSGHGFKHGPAVGAFAADLAQGKSIPPQFAFSTKQKKKSRQVY